MFTLYSSGPPRRLSTVTFPELSNVLGLDFARTNAFEMTHTAPRILLLAVVLAAGLLLIPGCNDPTVDVLQPSDRFRFSLFGTLDVAADTQAIRVEPLDDSVQLGASRDLNATVVLENLDSGEEVRLRDSLATFGTKPVVVHNFWTTHSIQPATSYRISVRREGDPTTSATTTTPAQPPDLLATSLRLPCVFSDDPNEELRSENSFTVTARNLDRIASVVVTYPIPDAPPNVPRSMPHLKGVENLDDQFVISVFYRPDLVELNPDPTPPPQAQPQCANRSDFARSSVQVEVAAGGPDWPKWRDVPFDDIARPDTFSNVQNGHGFVGGTYSKTIRVPITGRN